MRTVKAVGFREHGGLEQVEVLQVDVPDPGPGEARVRVEASALNHLDLFVLQGWPGLELEMPHVGGSDMAGVVEEVGEDVGDVAPGDPVVLYPSVSCGACRFCARGEVPMCRAHRLIGEHQRGTLAEEVVVPAANLRTRPEGFPAEDAAAAALAGLTAWRMLLTRGRLRAGESVLVVGSGGGVNTMAVQIARFAGARVTVVAGGEEKTKRARALGAHETVDYTEEEDWHRMLLSRRDGRGFDLVVDNVGKATWLKSLKACARGGRVVTVGGTTGYDPSAGLNYVFWKQLDILGSTMGTPQEFDQVMDHVYRGDLDAVVDRQLPLEEGPGGYRALEEGDVFGKVVVTP